MAPKGKQRADDVDWRSESQKSWKGKLGKAFGIGKKSASEDLEKTSSFLDMDPFANTLSPSSTQHLLTPGSTTSLSKSLYRLSHLAKSATNIRTMFGDTDDPDADMTDFNPPMSTVISPSASLSSAYYSTYSQDTLKSALLPQSPADPPASQSPFAEIDFPVQLGGQPDRPLVYNVEEWNVGRLRVGVERIKRSPHQQKKSWSVVDDTFVEGDLMAERNAAERLPLSWETDHWDDATFSDILSNLGHADESKTWGPQVTLPTPSTNPFDPRTIPGIVERSKPKTVAVPRTHARSPSTDWADAIPRRRQHSSSTIVQTNIPATTPTTPKFPPSGRYIPDPDATPRQSARAADVDQPPPSPTTSSICVPPEFLDSPPDPRDVSLPPSRTSSVSETEIEDQEDRLWFVPPQMPWPPSEVSSEGGGELGNVQRPTLLEPAVVSPPLSRTTSAGDLDTEGSGKVSSNRSLLSTRSPSATSSHFSASGDAQEIIETNSAGALLPISSALSSTNIAQSNITDTMAFPHVTVSAPDNAQQTAMVADPTIQPENIPLPPTPHVPTMLMYPSRYRRHVRQVSLESLEVILTTLDSRAPNFPPIYLPVPLDEHFAYAQRSIEHWFVQRAESHSITRIAGKLSFFWANFDEGWEKYVPASWDDVEVGQMTHDEQVIYFRRKQDELYEASQREEERRTRNARYIVERKRRGLPIVPDPLFPPPDWPPRVSPHSYGKDIDTRLHRRAKALRQMVWNVDDRSFSEIMHEEENFVGMTYRRTLGRKWAWGKNKKVEPGVGYIPPEMRGFTKRRVVRPRRDSYEDLFDDDDDEDWELEMEAGESKGAGGAEEDPGSQEGDRADEKQGAEQETEQAVDVAASTSVAATIDQEKAVESGREEAEEVEGVTVTADGETVADRNRNDSEGARGGLAIDKVENGSSTPKAIMASHDLLPRHTPIPRRARHFRNRHSLVGLQLERDARAVEVASEVNILATIAFPAVPHRDSTGVISEDVRVEIVPPTPLATRELLFGACETAEELWHPDDWDEEGSGDESGLLAARKADKIHERRFLAVPTVRVGSYDDEAGAMIDLGEIGGEEEEDEELWPGLAQAAEESRLMERDRRDREAWEDELESVFASTSAPARVLEGVPRIGESLVGTAMAWWQTGAGPEAEPGGEGKIHSERQAEEDEPGDKGGDEEYRAKVDYKGKGKAKE